MRAARAARGRSSTWRARSRPPPAATSSTCWPTIRISPTTCARGAARPRTCWSTSTKRPASTRRSSASAERARNGGDMGFLKDLVEDVESATRVTQWGWRRGLTILSMVMLVGYLLADSGHLGETLGDVLTTNGLSIFHSVTIDPVIIEEDPGLFDDGEHVDDELRVSVSGRVSPCTGPTTVRAALQRLDDVATARPAEWTQIVQTRADCRWQLNRPFFIADLGTYEVETSVRRLGHVIGSTSTR